MKKFLVLYMAPQEAPKEMMQTMTPESQEQEMKVWMEWINAHAANFVDQGNPVGKNTRITTSGATEISNEVMGYGIMQADSKEAVLEIMKGGPHLTMSQSYTEVMEIVEM
jgi:hypothetical protein